MFRFKSLRRKLLKENIVTPIITLTPELPKPESLFDRISREAVITSIEFQYPEDGIPIRISIEDLPWLSDLSEESLKWWEDKNVTLQECDYLLFGDSDWKSTSLKYDLEPTASDEELADRRDIIRSSMSEGSMDPKVKTRVYDDLVAQTKTPIPSRPAAFLWTRDSVLSKLSEIKTEQVKKSESIYTLESEDPELAEIEKAHSGFYDREMPDCCAFL